MLSFAEIEQKRAKNGISKYKLCKESTVPSANYYRLIKRPNATTKTLVKLGSALNRIIKGKKNVR
jgi:hypothetical protein